MPKKVCESWISEYLGQEILVEMPGKKKRMIHKRSEELAHAVGERWSQAVLFIMVPQDLKDISFLLPYLLADEFDTAVAKLYIEVILFRLHECENALSVSGPLYENIEPLDEITALHICLLLLDVALASNNATKAAEVSSLYVFLIGFSVYHVFLFSVWYLLFEELQEESSCIASAYVDRARPPNYGDYD
ncbi:hypothetical protein C5167_000368 [Papaver somniferum]|uniref:Uncharacterized protein n=1 Tax=Papaver somniferum TaxID=3469 RepID=A0A4Y7KV56_PAPSO|nr:hypothetical protein C5167_000368 [Papaver somniferum]